MRFTQEEFDTMLDEITYHVPARYDKLCEIVGKFITPKVYVWCKDSCNRDKDVEDVMQNISVRLLSGRARKYFVDKDGNPRPDRDPGKFGAWLEKLSRRVWLDWVEEQNRHKGIEPEGPIGPPEPLPEVSLDDIIEELQKAFAIVLDADASIYIKLTWLAQSILVLNADMTRIGAKDQLLRVLENRTLADMYEMVLEAADCIPWLTITDEQHARILQELQKPWKDRRRYGDVTYREFFMLKDGEPSGDKSVSVWVGRMDKLVKGASERGTESKSGKPKRTSGTPTARGNTDTGDSPPDAAGERRGDDEPFDI